MLSTRGVWIHCSVSVTVMMELPGVQPMNQKQIITTEQEQRAPQYNWLTLQSLLTLQPIIHGARSKLYSANIKNHEYLVLGLKI